MLEVDTQKKHLDRMAEILVDTGVSEEFLEDCVRLHRYQKSALAELERFLRKHGKIVKSPQ
jgi:hypothetical protein